MRNRKKIITTDPFNRKKEYNSIYAFAKKLGDIRQIGNICNAIKSGGSIKGFKVKYKDNEEKR